MYVLFAVGEFRQGVQVGDYELLQKALNRKRPYNMEMPDNIGMTLAMIAAQSGRFLIYSIHLRASNQMIRLSS